MEYPPGFAEHLSALTGLLPNQLTRGLVLVYDDENKRFVGIPLNVGEVALVDGATINTNAAAGNTFTVTLGGNRTIAAPSNPLPGRAIKYAIKQDATGSRTITWDAVFRWSGGSAPTLTTTAGKTDWVGAVYNSVAGKWDACLMGSNF